MRLAVVFLVVVLVVCVSAKHHHKKKKVHNTVTSNLHNHGKHKGTKGSVKTRNKAQSEIQSKVNPDSDKNYSRNSGSQSSKSSSTVDKNGNIVADRSATSKINNEASGNGRGTAKTMGSADGTAKSKDGEASGSILQRGQSVIE